MQNERKLIILCSRTDLDIDVKEKISMLLNEKLDWYLILKYSIKNKVLQLVYWNIKKLKLLNKIPENIRKIMEYAYLGNSLRNSILLKYCDSLLKEFNEEGIVVCPLKGSVLLPLVYKDMGIRILSDIDLMISYNDKEKVNAILVENGYKQAEIDYAQQVLKPLSREKQVVWTMHMTNMAPYAKVINEIFCNIVELDICLSLDYRRDFEFVDKMLKKAVMREEKMELSKSDFLLHLCTHLYKEARSASNIIISKDINLIKFCDFREYIKLLDSSEINETIQNAIKGGYGKALYYCMYYTALIYEDDAINSLLKKIDIDDQDFLNYFGEREFGKSIEWKKSFWDRLFDDNIDELNNIPQFYNILN